MGKGTDNTTISKTEAKSTKSNNKRIDQTEKSLLEKKTDINLQKLKLIEVSSQKEAKKESPIKVENKSLKDIEVEVNLKLFKKKNKNQKGECKEQISLKEEIYFEIENKQIEKKPYSVHNKGVFSFQMKRPSSTDFKKKAESHSSTILPNQEEFISLSIKNNISNQKDKRRIKSEFQNNMNIQFNLKTLEQNPLNEETESGCNGVNTENSKNDMPRNKSSEQQR